MRNGVLPKQTLNEIIDAGFITGIDKKYVNPASIDLPLTGEAYRLERVFLPLEGENIRTLLQNTGAESHDLRRTLEVGVPYLIKLGGMWKLPRGVYGYANPKSSTGRLNLFCRVVADKVPMYDKLSDEWSGELWVMVRADSFPVFVSPGIALSQMRLFDGKSFLDPLGLELAAKKTGLIFTDEGQPLKISTHADSIVLSIHIGGMTGFECRGATCTLDISKVGYHDPIDFGFEPLKPRNGSLVLRKNTFYILRTKECVMVPPDLSAELRPIDVRLGEFRTHAAGYIDPGWGWGTDGSVRGRPITLEVIPFEDTLIRDGQAIARLRYEWMREPPSEAYDSVQSNYTRQSGAQLSKHFKTS